MTKIRIIDLLNKIANGEKVPEKIKYQDTIFTLGENFVYTASDGLDRLLDHIMYDFTSVRDTVEIIEEQQDIDIQNIEMINEFLHIGDTSELDVKDERNIKINELIQAVKQLDRNIKDKE